MVIPFITPRERRRYGVMLRTITGIIAVLATVFLAWYEFGIQVFHNPVSWAILVLWVLFGWFSFLNAWDRAGDDEATERIEDRLDGIKEAIDKLANEIRQNRDERNKV